MNLDLSVKRCSCCNRTKLLIEFPRRKTGRYDSWCYECYKRRAAGWYADPTNRERQLVRQAARYANDPEHRAEKLATNAGWTRQNKDKVKMIRTRFYDGHPEYQSNKHRRERYGIEDVAAWLAERGGCCEICALELTLQTLNVDHNPVTNKVRGPLCWSHNVGLGHFHHDQGLLAMGIEYLDKYAD